MITKKTTPIIETINLKSTVTGSIVEYRIFGILFYKKTLVLPVKYGIKECEFYVNY